MSDPVEEVIATALTEAGVQFRNDTVTHLDFYLPAYDVYIECCRFHTPRKVEQTNRVRNVILIQGIDAARMFASLIT